MPLKHGRSVTPCTPHPFFVCHEIFVPTIAFSRQIFKTFSFFYVVTVQSPRFGLPVDLITGGYHPHASKTGKRATKKSISRVQ